MTGSCVQALCGVLLLTVNLCTAADLAIQAESNRQNIYLGESFDLTIKVSGTSANVQPDLSALKEGTAQYLGSQDNSYRSVEYINGRMKSKTEFSGRIHVYRITPALAGDFIAGPITITADGRTARTDGPKINVVGIEKQDNVILSISASKDTVLVDEPFDITIAVAIRRLPGRYSHLDPLNPDDPPRLYSPHLDSFEINGLEFQDLRELLGKILVTREKNPGFKINNYTVRQDPVNSFFALGHFETEKPAIFMFPRTEKTYSSEPFYEYSLTVRYIPRLEGSHIFGPTTFKGTIIREILPSGHVASSPIFAVGQAVTVRVIPPPEENRPESYIGAIGQEMKAKAELDAATCRVSDPLTLTLTISGNINLDNISPPRLSLQPELHENFKIYEDTVETEKTDTGKTFRLTVRPLHAGTQEFPAIALSYYDTKDRAYKTTYTEAIPLRVNETTRIITEAIINTATNDASRTDKISTAGKLLAAPLSMNPSGFIHQPVQLSLRHGIIMVSGPAIYFLIIAATFVRKKTARNPGQTRSKKALRNAGRILREKGNDTVSRAMISLIADRLGKNASGMTPYDVRIILGQNNVPPDMAVRYCNALQEHFNKTYSENNESESGKNEDINKISMLMNEIDNALPYKSKTRRKVPAHLLLTLGTLLSLGWMSGDCKAEALEIEREFLWNQAMSRVQTSSTKKDFLNAADVYSELIERGTANGHIFYNAATACLMAEDYENAMKNLIRAERHLGSDWAIRRNMLLAMSGGDETREVSLPWSRLVFFWHFGLSAFTRMNIAAISFSAIWIGFALAHFGLRKTGRTIITLSLIAFALFGSSAAESIHKEARTVKHSRTVSSEQIEP